MQAIATCKAQRVAHVVRLDDLAVCVQDAWIHATECEPDPFRIIGELVRKGGAGLIIWGLGNHNGEPQDLGGWAQSLSA